MARFVRLEQPLVMAGAALVFALSTVLPFLWPLAGISSAWPAVAAALGPWRLWSLLLRSIAISGAVTALALCIGVPVGAVLGRMDVPARRALFAAHAFPIALPPFLIALGWQHVLAPSAGAPGPSWLFSAGGLVLVLGLTFAPVVTALTALGVGGVDAALEDAGRLAASPARVLFRLLVPAARPAIALAAVIVFTLSLSDLGAAMFLRVDVYTAAVFARLAGADFSPGEAFGLALPLVPLALVLLALERRASGRGSLALLGVRGAARTPLPLGRWKLPAAAAIGVAAVASAAPIAGLTYVALAGGGLFEIDRWIGASALTSVLVAGGAATATTAVGVVLGHALARGAAGAGLLDALATLAFLLPPALAGVGMIAIWNRAATQLVYGSAAILVLGMTARYAVLGLRPFAASVAQRSPACEEAAAIAGAGYLARLRRIVVPLHARGALAAWLIAFVFALRDLDMAILFYPPGRDPLPVRIVTLEANGPPSVVGALALVQIALTAGALALGATALRRRST